MDELFEQDPKAVVSSNRILYTPSLFARTSLLHLQEIGELEAKKSHTSSRSGLGSYLFFTVLKGSGYLYYHAKEYSLKAGDCVFIDCDVPYAHTTSPDDLWTLKWIHFDGPSMPFIYSKYEERGGRPVFRPSESGYAEVWRQLMDTASGDDYLRDMLINKQLSELMLLLMRESWHPEDRNDLPPKKSLVLPVKEYLDKNYGEKITLDDLAARFFVNKFYLTKTFKAQYGQSINNYLLNVRITHAKQLLRFTDKPVEEIGLECGLGAANYFSSKFKEVEGIQPSLFREQW